MDVQRVAVLPIPRYVFVLRKAHRRAPVVRGQDARVELDDDRRRTDRVGARLSDADARQFCGGHKQQLRRHARRRRGRRRDDPFRAVLALPADV